MVRFHLWLKVYAFWPPSPLLAAAPTSQARLHGGFPNLLRAQRCGGQDFSWKVLGGLAGGMCLPRLARPMRLFGRTTTTRRRRLVSRCPRPRPRPRPRPPRRRRRRRLLLRRRRRRRTKTLIHSGPVWR